MEKTNEIKTFFFSILLQYQFCINYCVVPTLLYFTCILLLYETEYSTMSDLRSERIIEQYL